MRPRNLLSSYWLRVAVCLLLIPAGGGLGWIAASVHGSKLSQQGYHHTQGEQNKPEDTDTYSESLSSPFGLTTGRNLQECARYCGQKSADDMDKWAREYRCSIKSTDVYSALSSITVAFLTICLVAVGVVQCWIYLKQAKTMRGQADIAAEQALISDRQLRLMEDLERPLILLRYLGWAVEGWKHQADKRRFPDVAVSLSNFGRGTALLDHCRIGLFIGVNPPERQGSREQTYISALMRDEGGGRRVEPYTNFHMGARALSPGTDPWEIPLVGPWLTPEQMDEIGTGHQTVWIDAVAYYSDIRGNDRETHLRYVYDKDADIFIPDTTAPEFNRHT